MYTHIPYSADLRDFKGAKNKSKQKIALLVPVSGCASLINIMNIALCG